MNPVTRKQERSRTGTVKPLILAFESL